MSRCTQTGLVAGRGSGFARRDESGPWRPAGAQQRQQHGQLDNPSTPPATSTTTPSATPPPSSASGTVALAAQGSQLAFNATSETAKAGKVAIKFTNDSALQHNVTLADSSNKVLGKTPTFQGGTKSFSATLKPGTYTYYCSVPGHRQAGMQGTLTVK